MGHLSTFVAGVIATGYLVAGVYFLKFWTRTRDALFLAFSVAFTLLALNQFLLAASNIPREEQSWIFILRLIAFVLIALAIVYKNMTSNRR